MVVTTVAGAFALVVLFTVAGVFAVVRSAALHWMFGAGGCVAATGCSGVDGIGGGIRGNVVGIDRINSKIDVGVHLQ